MREKRILHLTFHDFWIKPRNRWKRVSPLLSRWYWWLHPSCEGIRSRPAINFSEICIGTRYWVYEIRFVELALSDTRSDRFSSYYFVNHSRNCTILLYAQILVAYSNLLNTIFRKNISHQNVKLSEQKCYLKLNQTSETHHYSKSSEMSKLLVSIRPNILWMTRSHWTIHTCDKKMLYLSPKTCKNVIKTDRTMIWAYYERLLRNSAKTRSRLVKMHAKYRIAELL